MKGQHGFTTTRQKVLCTSLILLLFLVFEFGNCFYEILHIELLRTSLGITSNLVQTTSNDESYDEDCSHHNLHYQQSNPTHQSYQSFNETNPHAPWCPYATCHNSPLCSPCNRRYLLIISTGRSGSTSLLNMLNQLPQVRLSGENNNALYYASKLISIHHQDHKPHILDQNYDSVDGAWMHNAIPPQAMACPIQHMLHILNPPPQNIQIQANLSHIDSNIGSNRTYEQYDAQTILGVKTIRFHDGQWTPRQAVNYLQTAFPCSRVVINIRTNISSQVQSVMSTFKWAKNASEHDLRDKISKSNEFLVTLGNILGDKMARVIDMTQWTTDVSIINDLISWLGYTDCSFAQLLHENKDGYQRDAVTDINLGSQCRLVSY